jgi:hypothetical protein
MSDKHFQNEGVPTWCHFFETIFGRIMVKDDYKKIACAKFTRWLQNADNVMLCVRQVNMQLRNDQYVQCITRWAPGFEICIERFVVACSIYAPQTSRVPLLPHFDKPAFSRIPQKLWTTNRGWNVWGIREKAGLSKWGRSGTRLLGTHFRSTFQRGDSRRVTCD